MEEHPIFGQNRAFWPRKCAKLAQYASVLPGAPDQAGASMLLVSTESWDFFAPAPAGALAR